MVAAATLVQNRVVSVESLKSVWTISQADVVMADGTAFVRLGGPAPIPILTEDLDHVPDKMRYLSPLSSKGLTELLRLREEAEERAAAEEDSTCTLFEPAKKKAKNSRDIVSEKRHNPKVIEIEIVVDDETIPIEIIRQVHRKDNLFVAYDAIQLAAIIHFIRSHGFEDIPSPEKLHLPRGIIRRNKKFLVKYTKADGCIGFKTKDTLEDAISWQLERQNEIVSECCNSSPMQDSGDIAEEPEAEEKHDAVICS